MKRFIFYFLFGFFAFFSATGMFILKYHVMAKENRLAQIHKQITYNNRSIHILKAEWTNLNTPERLRVLAKQNTSLQKTKPSQILNWSDISFREKH